MINEWQTILAYSDTMEEIADLSNNATSRSLQLALNRPGSYGFTIPMFTEWKDYLNPEEHCILLRKNKTQVWSGPIWTKSEDFAAQKITLSALSWEQILSKRFITSDVALASVAFTTTNEGEIAFSLLDIANAQEIDGVARPTGITRGTNTSTGTRSKTYAYWQNIGQEIQALTEIESGFDFTIDPITREMNIKNWDEYPDNTDAQFAFNFGPANTSNVIRETNADDMYNQWYVTGQYGTAEAHDTPSVNQYGLHQQVVNINEISNTSILAAIANAELAVSSNPRVNINFDPKASDSVTVPSLFEDFDIGDKVYLTAKQGDTEILDQGIRAFGLTVNIDENGIEKVTSLQTTYQGT